MTHLQVVDDLVPQDTILQLIVGLVSATRHSMHIFHEIKTV